MEQTPSLFHNRRVIVSSLISLAIVVFAFFSSYVPEEKKTPDLKVTDAIETGIHQDLDSDGLESWQEKLWGTDENNKDTDGDGTTDGEEVRIGRNPTIKGPKDKMGEHTVATTTANYYDDDPSLSTTEVVSRDILASYLAMKQSGTYSDASIKSFVGEITAKARERSAKTMPYFIATDVHTIPGESPEIYKTYANTLGTIFGQFRDDSKESELVTFTRSVEQKDPSMLLPLKGFEASYRTMMKLLIAVPVPEELASAHLAIANSYVELAESLSSLQHFDADPVANIAGIELYGHAVETVDRQVAEIRAKLLTKNVVLTGSDPGSTLFGMMGQ